jgi:superfamily I DNA and/or RNA helicase
MTSNAQELPRNLTFLFSRNRLNVAVSRARCLAFVVYCPHLLGAPARSIEEMRLLNGLCLLVETAAQAPRQITSPTR